MYNATPEQRTKEFRSKKYGTQNEKDGELTGMMSKLLSQQSAPNVDIDMLDGNPWNLTILCQYLRRWYRARLSTQETD